MHPSTYVVKLARRHAGNLGELEGRQSLRSPISFFKPLTSPSQSPERFSKFPTFVLDLGAIRRSFVLKVKAGSRGGGSLCGGEASRGRARPYGKSSCNERIFMQGILHAPYGGFFKVVLRALVLTRLPWTSPL